MRQHQYVVSILIPGTVIQLSLSNYTKQPTNITFLFVLIHTKKSNFQKLKIIYNAYKILAGVSKEKYSETNKSITLSLVRLKMIFLVKT